MKKVRVKLRGKFDSSYEIVIGRNLLKKIPAELKKKKYGNRYAIITDSNVGKKIGKKFAGEMKGIKLACELIVFPAGEKHKTLVTVEKLQEKMLAKGFDRKDCIIALGGGVTGDLAGFCAATFMRGIPFVQVPTTLLAMVDSSIGGKTGVDIKGGKNFSGAFYQPKKVFIDVSLLKNLPEKELRNGLSEVVKHAIIADERLFSFLESNVKNILKRDEAVLEKIIAKNCAIKAEVVEKDEKEENLRRILNFGHTIGHAIESATGFKKFSHGEAVAIGLHAEALVAEMVSCLSWVSGLRIRVLLEEFGLNTTLHKGISAKKILAEMKHDKKAIGGKVKFVLPQKIGKMISFKGDYGVEVSDKCVLEALREAAL
ncbi:MAG: 3-dehydroquinate synthase [Candidatus Diapherotrites archaeon]